MKQQLKNKIIVVLGMHRSGTSAITKSLEVLGGELGSRLMPAADGNNEKGFFEDVDINTLNVEMLNFLGREWHHVKSIDEHDFQRLYDAGFLVKAATLLRQKTKDTKTFIIKDPRLSILISFWKTVFTYCDFDVNYVVSVRNPISVCQSLLQRDGFVVEKSYLLWLSSYMAIFNNINDNVAYIDYDIFLKKPADEISRIASAFNLKVNTDLLSDVMDSFIDRKLRHTVYEVSDLEMTPECFPLIVDIYRRVIEVTYEDTELTFASELANWNSRYESLSPCLYLIDRLYDAERSSYFRANTLGQQLADVVANMETQQEELDSCLKLNAQNEKELENNTSVISLLETSISKLQLLSDENGKVIKSLSDSLNMCKVELCDISEQVTRKNSQVQTLELDVNDLNELIKCKDIEFVKKSDEISFLQQVVNDKDNMFKTLSESIVEKDITINRLNKSIEELNQQISRINSELTKKESLQITVDSLDEKILTINSELARKEEAFLESQKTVNMQKIKMESYLQQIIRQEKELKAFDELKDKISKQTSTDVNDVKASNWLYRFFYKK